MGKKTKRNNRTKKGASPNNSRSNALLRSNPGLLDTRSSAVFESQRYFQTSVKCLPPEEVVTKVRKGFGPTTVALADSSSSQELVLAEKDFLQGLVDADLVLVLLDFMGRANESIKDIVGEIDTASVGGTVIFFVDMASGEEGKVLFPSIWCRILSNLLCNWKTGFLSSESLRASRMKVAQGIGTFVNLMFDDMRCICYQEKSQWHEAFMPFIALLNGLVQTTDTIPILLEHDGLVSILVQCIFRLEHRPDIVEESKTYNRGEHLLESRVAHCASSALATIMKSQYENSIGTPISVKGREIIRSIGATLVLNKLYDPTCNVSFTAGLLSLLKTKKDDGGRSYLRDCVRYLVDNGCADKAIIREVLNLGLNYTTDVKDALFILKASFGMLSEKDSSFMDTALTTYAVKSGLFSVIVKLLSRFGTIYSDVVACADQLVHLIHAISARNKLPKALANLSGNGKLMSALQSLGDVAKKTNNGDLAKLVLAIRTEIFMKGMNASPPSCSNCQQDLECNAVRYCSRCNDSAYCSEACQRSHWKVHKRICVKTEKKFAKSREKSQHESKEFAAALLQRSTESFLMEALIKGIDILDCYVMIQLQQVPPRVHLLQPGSREEASVVKELGNFRAGIQQDLQILHRTIASVRDENMLPAFICSQLGETQVTLITNDTMSTSWPDAQKLIAHEVKDLIDSLRENPHKRDLCIQELQLQRVSRVLDK